MAKPYFTLRQLSLFFFLCVIAIAGAKFGPHGWRGSPRSSNLVHKSKVEILGQTLKKFVNALRNAANKQVDLVFLVDSSASVGADNFFNELKFVKKLLADFTVAYNETRVAVITFSSRNRVIRQVDHLSDPSPDNHKCALLEEGLPKIRYTGGGTYTLGALLEAQQVLKSSRPSVPKAVFLITDGYSNGGDPRPVARDLRRDGVQVFTFGIRNGNVRELYDMASEPAEEHSYILDSFEEFEALARRALHEDLHIGDYLPQPSHACKMLCNGSNCCDENAVCTCGTHTGHYACICEPGFFGSGLLHDCKPCPARTYRDTTGPGDFGSCTPCPDMNQVSEVGSTSVEQCICKRGFRRKGKKCTVTRCPKLLPPNNGYFVKNVCNNVFNAACGIRCNTGYKLQGSSIRLCQEDGTWSGEEARCVMKNCTPLRPPKFGSMVCTQSEYVFETECHFTCDAGYTLVGSKKRSCLAISLWDGLPTNCRPVFCPALGVPIHGSVLPVKCTTQKSQYGETCDYFCQDGFALKGPAKVQCVDPGNWSPEHKKPKCIDVEPPKIVCPDNIVVEADENSNGALVTWTEPMATDNTNQTLSITIVPAIVLPVKFPIGTATVSYTAEDRMKNKAECSFNITVLDTQPPVIDRCVSPPTFLSKKKVVEVEWDEPLFSDNSGGTVYITQSHVPGFFPAGETSVVYIAKDESGNNSTCIITITVHEHSCSTPSAPAQGNASCSEEEANVVCSLACADGYTFAVKPPVNYFCAYNGIWLPSENFPWPDCSATYLSNTILQIGIIAFQTDNLPCDDSFFLTQLENHVTRKVDPQVSHYCPDEMKCDVSDIVASCHMVMSDSEEISNSILYRKKRDNPKQLISSLNSNNKHNFQNPQHLTFGQGSLEDDLDYAKRIQTASLYNSDSGYVLNNAETLLRRPSNVNHVGHSSEGYVLPSGDASFENKWSPTNTELKAGSVSTEQHDDLLKPGFSPQTESDEGKTLIDVEVKVKGTMLSNSNRTNQSELMKNMKIVMSGLDHAGINGELDITLGSHHFTYVSFRLRNDKSEFLCEPGSISEGSSCVKCPVGTFFNVMSEVCQSCNKGTYQFSEGQQSCLVCPDRTSTSHDNARSPRECKAQCLPGSFSPDGLEICETCGKGFYQLEYAQTACLSCPGNTTTWKRGARRKEECQEPCLAGYVSETGLTPCFPCPLGFFQERAGQTSCLWCPGRVSTNATGSTELRNCEGFGDIDEKALNYFYPLETLEVNECFSLPCLNGATCRTLEFGYVCDCVPGFTGMYCGTDIDECASLPCQNNGTCVDDLNKYVCHCTAGYEGVSCEIDIDECALLTPCVNGATCIDHINGFFCRCLPGYQGYFCELDINECAIKPCFNNGTCVDLIAGYTCDCTPGFSGEHCEINTDECDSDPCLNNGTCLDDDNSFRCLCPRGFLGSSCEIDINECNPSLCVNGATCVDEVAKFTCICPPSFSGLLCETELSPNFFLHFPSSGTMDHVQVGGIRFSLTELTLCMWIKTADKTNYGTPFSYATDEQANTLTITDYSGFVLYVLGDKVITDVTANDDEWHMVCFTWQSKNGSWAIYKDGQLEDDGFGLATDNVISEKGTFVLGQEQDFRGGGFSAAESFIGSLALVNLWDKVLNKHTIQQLSVTCENYIGNVKAWPDFLGGLRGRVQVDDSTFCKGCLALDPPDHGSLSVTGSLTGASANYTCDTGFTLRGEALRQCMVHGKWSGTSPWCNRLSCGFPGYLVNGQLNGNGYNYGDRIVYSCNVGFKLYGNMTRTCLDTGIWTDETPTCEEIFCDVPLPVQNGEVITVLNTFRAGDRIEYKCDEAYILTGAHTLACNDNGVWDRPPPMCLLASCSEMPSIPFGYIVSEQDSIGIGENVIIACHPGYQIIGNEKVHCLLNKKWEEPLPLCQLIDCGPPPSILFGNYSVGDTTYNNTATYMCDVGYNLEGISLICEESGNWSSNVPSCTITTCEQLQNISNGDVYVTGYEFRNLAQYVCKPGFELKGDRVRECLQNRIWSGSTPVCVRVYCNAPSDISNGYFSNEVLWEYGKAVTYHCNAGYKLIGSSSRSCLSNGSWEFDIPTCIPVTCPQPESLENGFYTGDNIEFGHHTDYYCNEGFVLEGSSTRLCVANGTWSNKIPKCRPISCNAVVNIQNGHVNVKSFTFKSIAEYSCNLGFTLVGGKSRECLSNSSWSGEEPFCEIIKCPLLKSPLHGHFNLTSYDFGSTVMYWCDRGYVLVGQSEQTCTKTKQWSGSEPYCVPVNCSAPESIPNGFNVFISLNFNSTAVFECNRGYILNGSKIARCLEDGSWGESFPVCIPLQCIALSPPLNAQGIGNSSNVGATVQFVCDTGYKLLGSPVITCQLNQSWDNELPSCERVSCPTPNALNNRDYIGTQFMHGDVVKYTCSEGYEIIGSSERHCLANGHWNETEPVCVPVSCLSPPTIFNGSVVIHGLTYLEKMDYACDEGFQLDGQSELTCLASKQWSAKFPACKLILCPVPQFILNGELTITGRTVGSTLQYFCKDGYEGIGEFIRTCNVTGKWSGSSVNCHAVSCPEQFIIKHGKVFGSNFTFGNILTFSCDDGYKLIGEDQARCEANKQWSNQLPTCVITKCSQPKKLNHGTMVGKEFLYGSFVEYHCERGYVLHGPYKRQCLVNGTWSHHDPTCEPVLCPKPNSIFPNGFIVMKSNSFGNKVTFACNAGFAIVGDSVLTCTDDGNWTGKYPSCKLVVCDLPSFPKNGGFKLYNGSNSKLSKLVLGYDIDTDTKVKFSNRTKDINPEIIPLLEPNSDSVLYGTVIQFYCIYGYKLEGQSILKCESLNSWSDLNPTCNPINCDTPSVIANGVIISSSNRNNFRDKIEYACHTGYKLHGEKISECLGSGLWSGTQPECKIIHCSQLLSIPHGSYRINSSNFGGEAVVKCDVGYKLVGSVSRVCNENGIWSGIDPVCEPITCSDPEPLQFGSYEIDSLLVGGVITFYCNFGYELVGDPSRTCLLSGNWSALNPVCMKIICKPLEPVPHSSIASSGWDFGALAEYKCNVGYELIGTSVRTCLQNKTWSGFKPECRQIFCLKLHPVANGKMFGKDLSVGGIVTFVCADQYELVGPHALTCQSNGVWTSAAPQCQIITCKPIKSIINGQAIGKNFVVGGLLKFVCNQGYVLSGPPVVSCVHNKTWNDTIPVCRRGQCASPPAVEHADIIGSSFAIGDKIRYRCKVGFKLTNTNMLQCSNAELWEGTIPQCEVVTCGEPVYVANSRTHFVSPNPSMHVYGATVFYTCNDGYELRGDYGLLCEIDGSWAGDPPACVQVACGVPPIIQFATVHVENHANLSRAIYHCNPGYITLGMPVIECLTGGIWQENVPLCVPVTCGDPPQVRHAQIRATSLEYLSVVNYTCVPGFRPVGSSSITCGPDGLWRGHKPRCVAVGCGRPQVPPNALLDGDDFLFRSAVIYLCEPGYRLEGQEFRICQSDGTWSGDAPQCVLLSNAQCNDLNSPHNGFVMVDGLKPSHKAKFKCQKGYMIIGQEVLTCQSTGRWDSPAPHCSIVTCKPPPTPVHAVNVGYDEMFSYGDRISYACEDGFRPSTSMMVQCLDDGTWTEPIGGCVRVSCGRPRASHGALILGMSYLYQDRLAYTCPPGKRPENRPLITCQEDGKWDFEPSCIALCRTSCLNGGTCIRSGMCSCPSGFMGRRCQHAVCILPCLNGGTCTGPYSCQCRSGYTGHRCERAICRTQCENGGRCVGPDQCWCPPGFLLPNCSRRR